MSRSIFMTTKRALEAYSLQVLKIRGLTSAHEKSPRISAEANERIELPAKWPAAPELTTCDSQ